MDSGDGGFFVALEENGATLSTTLSGLTLGAPYQLTFLAAGCPAADSDHVCGHRNEHSIIGLYTDDTLLRLETLAQSFFEYKVRFTAAAESAAFKMVNKGASGANRVFADHLRIRRTDQTIVRDTHCGNRNASLGIFSTISACHEACEADTSCFVCDYNCEDFTYAALPSCSEKLSLCASEVAYKDAPGVMRASLLGEQQKPETTASSLEGCTNDYSTSGYTDVVTHCTARCEADSTCNSFYVYSGSYTSPGRCCLIKSYSGDIIDVHEDVDWAGFYTMVDSGIVPLATYKDLWTTAYRAFTGLDETATYGGYTYCHDCHHSLLIQSREACASHCSSDVTCQGFHFFENQTNDEGCMVISKCGAISTRVGYDDLNGYQSKCQVSLIKF
ncbi:hypothetical protein CYMTET_4244 [Cymbomonas tetramitiformis]|uniref:Uncharacterized protein n=1 Tax=Cymbomonas tetramitiformis TaxID=36881 RepID=A0AAE0LKA2_9CHLO|nr:hypothetical protein CYMTET_4244 [Cymbomonas tetramitiformis]